PPADHERFERHYLATSERRQQVEFARAMNRSLDQTVSTASAGTFRSAGASSLLATLRSSLLAPLGSLKLALGFSLALAAVLALGGAWLLIHTSRLRHELAQTQINATALHEREQELERQIAFERGQSQQLTAELERIRDQLRIAEEQQSDPRSAPAIITLKLSGSPDRDKSLQQAFRVPPNAEIVQIELKLKNNDYPNYQATVKTAEGKYLWSRKQVQARGTTVFLRVPAKLFLTGDYILTLSGASATGEVEDVSQSYF